MIAFTLSMMVVGVAAGAAAAPPKLDPHLEPLRPMLDKTWKGAFKESTPEKPMHDVMHWERILNGQAVRVMHSVNDGMYGGETIFRWDDKKKAVTYHYFTTAGFMTVGTAKFEDGKCVTNEVVEGASGGVTEVRGTSEVKADGTFHIVTDYLTDGKWVPARDMTYKVDPKAKVVFK